MSLFYYILGEGFRFVFRIIVRFEPRSVDVIKSWHEQRCAESKNIMLLGAGNAAQMFLRDMTRNREITDRVVCGNPFPFDEDASLAKIGRLMKAAYANEERGIRDLIRKIVSTYHPEDDESEYALKRTA